MRFRPCIDIHNGKVKQIVGSSLDDRDNRAAENFVSEKNAGYYAGIYRDRDLRGGHIILLNSKESDFYEQTKRQAMQALEEFPGGLQIGGGIEAENAAEFLDAGASHVIITSYVFTNGEVMLPHLKELKKKIGKKKVVLDLSCRKKMDSYYIMTNRWQKYTKVKLNHETLDFFSDYCDEFLIHAVEVEGKSGGIETELVRYLGKWDGLPITYAGGVHELEDIKLLKELGAGKIDVTVGSALELFGGSLSLDGILSAIS